MKTFKGSFLILAFLFYVQSTVAQPPIRIIAGKILINDGTLGFIPKKYTATMDSLDKILKAHPSDTSTLFYRALLYSLSNNLTARPYQRENGALENLIVGKNQIEKAISLGMMSIKTRVLRAQLCRDITYRFTGDESWMFNKANILDRKTQYNQYKELTNKYYDELSVEDKNNAWNYQKIKVKEDYPIKQ